MTRSLCQFAKRSLHFFPLCIDCHAHTSRDNYIRCSHLLAIPGETIRPTRVSNNLSVPPQVACVSEHCLCVLSLPALNNRPKHTIVHYFVYSLKQVEGVIFWFKETCHHIAVHSYIGGRGTIVSLCKQISLLTHSLTHSLSHSLTHSLARSLTHSLTPSGRPYGSALTENKTPIYWQSAAKRSDPHGFLIIFQFRHQLPVFLNIACTQHGHMSESFTLRGRCQNKPSYRTAFMHRWPR